MNNEQMVSRLEMAHVVNALDKVRGGPVLTSNQCHDLARELNKVLAQPAAQYQGEPVAWCQPHWSGKYAGYCWGPERPNSPCPELWKPLYTHADAGEVGQGYHHTVVEGLVNRNNELREERDDLRAERDEWKQRCQYNADTAHDVARERDTLRAQLAELGALLRLARQFVVNGVDLGYIQMPDADTPDPAHDLVPKIDAALSASAEPSAPACSPCNGTGYAHSNGMPVPGTCDECKGTGLEPSAPVERDERAAFEAEGITYKLSRRKEFGCTDEYEDSHTQFAWAGWQARAALERKS